MDKYPQSKAWAVFTQNNLENGQRETQEMVVWTAIRLLTLAFFLKFSVWKIFSFNDVNR